MAYRTSAHSAAITTYIPALQDTIWILNSWNWHDIVKRASQREIGHTRWSNCTGLSSENTTKQRIDLRADAQSQSGVVVSLGATWFQIQQKHTAAPSRAKSREYTQYSHSNQRDGARHARLALHHLLRGICADVRIFLSDT